MTLPAPRERKTTELPRWVLRATAALSAATARIRVIAGSTPLNLSAELARLELAFSRGEDLGARFEYAPPVDHASLRAALEEMSAGLEVQGPLGLLHAERARELSCDAALCETAGRPGFWAVARRRYAARDAHDAEADALAAAWLAPRPRRERTADDDGHSISDDERDPRSLLVRLREELGRRRLAFSVVVNPNLASLAATGDACVQVVAGRRLSRADVERTVLHEVVGHVAPRVASSREGLGLFTIGTASGSDDQEGRALALERAAGFLEEGRRRELALRHVAARSVEASADFTDTVRLLLEHGSPPPAALRIAARVHRGGGLAREAVYLPALLRVEAAVRRDPSLDAVLARGRVSVAAAPVLRELFG